MIQAVIYKTMSWYQGYGHYGYGHSFVSFSCFLMRKRWAAGHGKVIFEYPIWMVTANVGQWYAGYMEEVLRYVYNKSWTFGHLLWTEAIYIKPHGGVEDLWPRALTRLRSHGLERTGSINSVLSWIFELCQTKKASPVLGSQAPDSREVRGTPFFFFFFFFSSWMLWSQAPAPSAPSPQRLQWSMTSEEAPDRWGQLRHFRFFNGFT